MEAWAPRREIVHSQTLSSQARSEERDKRGVVPSGKPTLLRKGALLQWSNEQNAVERPQSFSASGVGGASPVLTGAIFDGSCVEV